MNTNTDDDDLEIPELTDEFWARAVPNPYAKAPGEKRELCVDGAVGYRLRLIPSNKVLGDFTSTLEAWPAIIDAVASGRSPRTLTLDWVDAEGRGHKMSAGRWLVSIARLNNGGPHPNANGALTRQSRRSAAD